ncbi:TetR/AcrR family transcriptional regulator [Erythrobacter sp. THAF29]|uniref:TetR/AcrR family transcriptional regulator n=1 Tax=Erythrobacter sp. THAF29 TaxID=2587851 RepID=UPI00126928A2|nr:TetR/AcrR family transcriptional regulator [Erythrobacter sp. THAF29]QFT76926.1 HTH-type transcriptional regulator SrpR [Erythrobacter sp. THAF29]
MTEIAQKKRTRLTPEKRRDLILDHAAEIVAREGVANLSMDQVGREAGVSKSLVYNYFANLNELLRALLERELKRLRRAQRDAAEAAETFEDLVRGVTHEYLNYIDQRGLIIERLQSEPSVSEKQNPADYSREAAVDYLAVIAENVFDLPAEIARATTDISIGIPSAAGAYLLQRRLPLEEVEDLTTTMIMGVFTAVKSDYMVNKTRLRRTGD